LLKPRLSVEKEGPAFERIRGGSTHHSLHHLHVRGVEGQQAPLRKAGTGDGIEVGPGDQLALADQVHARMRQADAIVRKLAASGWEITRHQGLLFLEHPDVTTGEEVEERLRSLGIDPLVVAICDTTYYEELIGEG
jgi:hypothetical protein